MTSSSGKVSCTFARERGHSSRERRKWPNAYNNVCVCVGAFVTEKSENASDERVFSRRRVSEVATRVEKFRCEK